MTYIWRIKRKVGFVEVGRFQCLIWPKLMVLLHGCRKSQGQALIPPTLCINEPKWVQLSGCKMSHSFKIFHKSPSQPNASCSIILLHSQTHSFDRYLCYCVIEGKSQQTVCAQAYIYVLTMTFENCGVHPSNTIFGTRIKNIKNITRCRVSRSAKSIETRLGW